MRQSVIAVLFMVFWVSHTAWGTDVTVTEKAKIYRKEGKRLISEGEVEAGTKVRFQKTLDKGKWVQGTWGDKTIILSAKKVSGVPANRGTASTGSSTETVSAVGRSSFGVGPSVGYGTSLSALAIGLGAFYNPKDWLNPAVHQLSVGGYFHYFLVSSLVAGGSSSAMSFAGVLRYQYHLTPEFDVGAEAGASLVNTSASVTVAGVGTVSASASTFQALFGAFGRYRASPSLQVTLGLRGLGVPNFLGGVEYQF